MSELACIPGMSPGIPSIPDMGGMDSDCPDVFISWPPSSAEACLADVRSDETTSAATISRESIFRTKESPWMKTLQKLIFLKLTYKDGHAAAEAATVSERSMQR
jgi:hypothetical protein